MNGRLIFLWKSMGEFFRCYAHSNTPPMPTSGTTRKQFPHASTSSYTAGRSLNNSVHSKICAYDPCQYRDDLSRYGISTIKIRRSWDDLIFVMGILYSPWWWIYFRNHKDIFAFCLISQHGKGTINWICVLLRVNILLFYPCPSGPCRPFY